MEITKELVEYVSNLSNIRLDEETSAKMENELSDIIKYMDVLNGVETDGIEPMSHVFSIKNVLREDEIKDSYPRELILKNAPEQTNEAFVVPKIVE